VFPSEVRKEQRDRAAQWMDKHWPEPRTCPICGTNSWNVGDVVSTPLAAGSLDGPVSVYFPVGCLTCGHTYFFDALIIGAIEGGRIEPYP